MDRAPRWPRLAPRRWLCCEMAEFQASGCPSGQAAVPRHSLDGIKRRSSNLLSHFPSSLYLSLSSFSSPVWILRFLHQFFTLTHQIHHLYHHRHHGFWVFFSWSSLSLFLSSERNKGGRRPTPSIKFIPSFARQGNSLSSNLLLFLGYGRIFLED